MYSSRLGFKFRCKITDASGAELYTDEVCMMEDKYVVIDDVKYVVENGAAAIVTYTGSSSTLVIPATVKDVPVTAVGASAFEGNTNLTSIDLPDSIQVIGSRAFANCTNLSTIN